MTAKEIQAIMDRIQTWPAEKQQLAYDLLTWIEGKEEDDASDLTAEVGPISRKASPKRIAASSCRKRK
ncbi:MAG TPA: hypothetical protein VHZ29_07200 [Rhizomicrobium sp.]|nr:hypothetical protein [Rhizomicrobium sp.]